MTDKKISYVSASSLKSFRKCPYSLNAQFHSSEAAQFGESVHYAIATWLRSQERTFEVFKAAFEDKAKIYKLEESRKDQIVDIYDNISERFNIAHENILTIESDDETSIRHGKPCFQVQMVDEVDNPQRLWGFRGAIDLAYMDNDGILNIVDWKTGITQADDDLQLAVYALACARRYGNFPLIRTMFVYVQQNGIIVKSEWDTLGLMSAYDILEPLASAYFDMLEKVPREQFPRTPHEWCKYCEFKDTCTAYYSQIDSISSLDKWNIEEKQENFQKIIDAFEMAKSAEKAVKQIIEDLKNKYESILEKNGNRLAVNGKNYVLSKKNSSYNYDSYAIFSDLKEEMQLSEQEALQCFDYCKKSAEATVRKNMSKEEKKRFDELTSAHREVVKVCNSLKVTLDKNLEKA